MSVGYRTYGFCNGHTEERRGKKLVRHLCQAPMPDGIPHDDPRQFYGLAENHRRMVAILGWTRDGDRDYCPECSRRREKSWATFTWCR